MIMMPVGNTFIPINSGGGAPIEMKEVMAVLLAIHIVFIMLIIIGNVINKQNQWRDGDIWILLGIFVNGTLLLLEIIGWVAYGIYLLLGAI